MIPRAGREEREKEREKVHKRFQLLASCRCPRSRSQRERDLWYVHSRRSLDESETGRSDFDRILSHLSRFFTVSSVALFLVIHVTRELYDISENRKKKTKITLIFKSVVRLIFIQTSCTKKYLKCLLFYCCKVKSKIPKFLKSVSSNNSSLICCHIFLSLQTFCSFPPKLHWTLWIVFDITELRVTGFRQLFQSVERRIFHQSFRDPLRRDNKERSLLYTLFSKTLIFLEKKK